MKDTVSYYALIKAGACPEGGKFFREHWGRGSASIYDIAQQLSEHDNGMSWFSWLVEQNLVPEHILPEYRKAQDCSMKVWRKYYQYGQYADRNENNVAYALEDVTFRLWLKELSNKNP